jgi:hypothetical protein
MIENTYTNAQYTIDPKSGVNNAIEVIINENEQPSYVPLNPGNRHYDEIMRQVDEGQLTIAEAD